MKYTIDTENKTISIDENINIKDLVAELKKIMPNNWKEYSFENTIISYPFTYYPTIDFEIPPCTVTTSTYIHDPECPNHNDLK